MRITYRSVKFERSRSKVKVTEVKSSIFGLSTITQIVFVRFAQNLVFRSRKSSDICLLMDDLERSKVKVTAGVKLSKFAKKSRFPHFLS